MSSLIAARDLRRLLLGMLGDTAAVSSTADLRRALSDTLGTNVVHEVVYRNLQILEKRGQVTRHGAVGRHCYWQLRAGQPRRASIA